MVPDDPARIFGAAPRRPIPLLIGWAADEGLFFANDAPTSRAGYEAFIHAKFPGQAGDRVLARFPVVDDTDARTTTARVFGLYELIAPTVLAARAASLRGPVFLYRFSRVSPGARTQWGGAAHGVELPYVFDLLDHQAGQFERRDRELSRTMADAWVAFIKTGRPGAVRWPMFAQPSYQHLELGDAVRVQRTELADIAFFREIFESMASGGAPRQ